jgi:hypothetical protein
LFLRYNEYPVARLLQIAYSARCPFMKLRALQYTLAALALASGCGQPGPTETTQPVEPIATNAPTAQPVANELRAPLAKLVAMIESGLAVGVVQSHVALSTNRFSVTPQEIQLMKDAGVPQIVIFAMLQRDTQLRGQNVQREREQAVIAARVRAQTEARVRELALTRALLTAQSNQFAAHLAQQQAMARAAQNPAPAPRANQNLPAQVQPFHTALKQHGTWSRHANHGWVWQPTAMRQIRDWRPYAFNGRWLSTDQGWYWHSDDPWGWAVYHYGRWGHEQRTGWYWVPDTTWGPSWVTFRADRNYIGWAPLPPGSFLQASGRLSYRGRAVGVNYNFGLGLTRFSFVSYGRVFHPHLSGFILPHLRARPFFNNTTVINNLVNSGGTVINTGMPISRVAEFSSRPAPIGVIRTSPEFSVDQFGRSIRTANQTLVFRPGLQHIAPVRLAVLSQGGTERQILVPASSLNGVVIAGRPVVDTSTGVPVVTGYTTRPERTRPQVTIVNSTNVTSQTTSDARPGRSQGTTSNGGPIPVNTTLQQARNNGFFNQNSGRQSYPRPMSPPRPITSVPLPLSPPQPVIFRQPTNSSNFRYNSGSSSYYNR